jgi:LDH2 family malate/lactate/ureidoglycolate dehydrogenase
MVGIVLCNAEPVVAPFRGRVRALGTNPIALSSPRAGGGAPIVLDVATASVAEGKLALALSEGRMVDHGQIVDSVGRDSTDPRDFYAGGALLPFGGHKGYGISVFVEILGGILSGAGAASAMKYVRGNGAHVIAIDVRTFLPLSQFEGEIEELADNLAGAGGVDDPVLLPGQLEGDSRARRTAEGIELPVETWRDLCELTARLGIDMTQLPPLPDLDGRRLTPQENA